jgi:hypothetical protein
MQHHQDDLRCYYCGWRSLTPQALKDHEWAVHDFLRDRKWRGCNLCGAVSESQEALYWHLHQDHVLEDTRGPKCFSQSCKSCPYVAKSYLALVEHIWVTHESLYNPFTRGCQRCGQFFYNLSDFELPLINQHGAKETRQGFISVGLLP